MIAVLIGFVSSIAMIFIVDRIFECQKKKS